MIERQGRLLNCPGELEIARGSEVILAHPLPIHFQKKWTFFKYEPAMYSTEGGTSRETCARHVRRAISPASFNLEGYKLA